MHWCTNALGQNFIGGKYIWAFLKKKMTATMDTRAADAALATTAHFCYCFFSAAEVAADVAETAWVV